MLELARHEHPGRALYEIWDMLLRLSGPTREIGHGAKGWGLWDHAKGVIAYGQNPHAAFLLAEDGRFQILTMHGTYRRNGVAHHTFLNYGHANGAYQWAVEFNPAEKVHTDTRWPSRTWHTWCNLHDWRNPVRYVSENLTRSNRQGTGWRGHLHQPWLVVTKAGYEQWAIRPAPEQDHFEPDALEKAFDHFEQIVQRRYARREALDTDKAGALASPAPVLLDRNQKLTHDQSVSRLAALLEVSRPAKTTRPEEANHGSDHLDPLQPAR